MTNELQWWCQHCKKELPPSHTGPCPHCGKTGKYCKVPTGGGVVVIRSSLRAGLRRGGFKKFVKEILQGWFSSASPDLKDGVYMERVIDREKDEYHHVVKDARTGEVIHDEHELLSQHKPKQPKDKKK